MVGNIGARLFLVFLFRCFLPGFGIGFLGNYRLTGLGLWDIALSGLNSPGNYDGQVI